MFGNPAWFRKKTVGRGLRPVSWKGWLYVAVWSAVVCVPFVGLLACSLVIEALIWVAVMMLALAWDVRHVRRDMETARRDTADILVIDEHTEPDPSYFATRSYDLELRHKRP